HRWQFRDHRPRQAGGGAGLRRRRPLRGGGPVGAAGAGGAGHGGAGGDAEGSGRMTRKFTGDRLVIASHNRGKLEEFSALLAPLNVACVSAADLSLPEPEETESTFIGNARIKAKAAALASCLPALADDS